MHYSETVALTAKGYNRIRVSGRQVMEHVYVWQQHHGRLVPTGYDIHHIDGDKLNNAVGNLRLVSRTEHKRIHGGCQIRDGVWWKPCGICGEFKPIGSDHWYLSREGWPLYGRCRPCHIAKVGERKQRLRRVRTAEGG
jgi:hypothetical protein